MIYLDKVPFVGHNFLSVDDFFKNMLLIGCFRYEWSDYFRFFCLDNSSLRLETALDSSELVNATSNSLPLEVLPAFDKQLEKVHFLQIYFDTVKLHHSL